MTKRLFRVPLVLTQITNGYVDILAETEDKAVDEALRMDKYDLRDGQVDYGEHIEWGSCGDYWEIEVFYEDGVEDVTPPTVSELLWKS